MKTPNGQGGSGSTTTQRIDATDTIPEQWPAPDVAAPVDARPISWLLFPFAPLGVMLRPSAIGCRLARSSWFKAFAIHLLALMLTGLIALAAEMVAEDYRPTSWGNSEFRYEFEDLAWDRMTAGEIVRLPFALLFTTLYYETDRLNAGEIVPWVFVFHVSCWILALLAMPLLSAGERPRRLFGRSLKLVLWCTTMLVPAMVLLGLIRVGLSMNPGGSWGSVFDAIGDEDAGVALTVLIFVPWSVSVLLRLASRYAGPAEGPAWQRPAPRCNGCGYTIVGLPQAGRCPECGRDLADSLPDARRLPAWAQPRRWWGGPSAYVRTAWPVLRDRRFFDTLAVRRSTREAARFAMWTAVVVGLIVTLGSVARDYRDVVYARSAERVVRELTPVVMMGLFAAVSALIVMCMISLRAAFTSRIDPRTTWNAVLYASAFLLPPAILISLWLWAIALVDRYFDLEEIGSLGRWGGEELDAEFFMLISFALTVFAAFAWAVMRIRRAILAVKFAA